MKRPFLIQPHQYKSGVSLLGLALFFLLFVLGCSRGGDEAPLEEGTPQQQGTLVCSEECAARGQCGKTVNGNEPVILGHPGYPAVQEHQMIFQANATVPIVGATEELVEVISTGEQFPQTFFLLQRSDGQTGWVAGWCLNPQ